MSQQVQELIDKIKTEGFEEAQKKSTDIESKAHSDAQKIIDDAKLKAEKLVIEANEEIKRVKESTEMALKQSARDMILSLRKELEATLQKIIQTEVKASLTAEQLGELLNTLIKQSSGQEQDDIKVTLNEKDLKNIKDSFLAKLQKQVKQSIHLSSSSDIDKGFMISFDSGKSSFDFTDQSLTNYLGGFLNSEVSSLLNESVS